jgi:penicillin-binding protein activator
MKNRVIIALIAVSALIFAYGCASDPSTTVTRVDASTQTDLSGYWNDTDLRTVCTTLIDDCLASPRVSKFQKQNGKLPVIIVGSFRNNSDEHIDTSIISKKMEAAIVNSGQAEFVASKSERDEIRDERSEQQSWASEESVKALANETGADFMLTGSVKTIVDQAGGVSTRTYYVSAELIDVETNKKIWIGDNSDIKKIIKRSSVKF